MLNAFEVQFATRDDVANIQCLFKKMFEIYHVDQNIEYPYPSSDIKYLHHCIDNGIALVEKHDKEVIGFITGGIEAALPFKIYRRARRLKGDT